MQGRGLPPIQSRRRRRSRSRGYSLEESGGLRKARGTLLAFASWQARGGRCHSILRSQNTYAEAIHSPMCRR